MAAYLKSQGYAVVEEDSLYDWQKGPRPAVAHADAALPAGAAEHLSPENPRLLELQRRYEACDSRVTSSAVWNDGHVRAEDIRYFRGDNAYVWQRRGANMNPAGYALSTYYAMSIDRLGLLSKLREDASFGAFTYDIAGRVVSRDLLDSILELHFLEKHLKLSRALKTTVWEIGAGYGRLADRMATAFPSVSRYACSDAVPVSSFLCEYYTRWRGLEERVTMLPLDEVEAATELEGADLCVNVHSFSECRIAAIEWWMDRVREKRVRHLFIVPNPVREDGAVLCTNDGTDFSGVIAKAGYRLVAREPKYADPAVQRYGTMPTHYHLFALES